MTERSSGLDTAGFVFGGELVRFAGRLGYPITEMHADDIASYRESTEASVASLRARTDVPATTDPAGLLHILRGAPAGQDAGEAPAVSDRPVPDGDASLPAPDGTDDGRAAVVSCGASAAGTSAGKAVADALSRLRSAHRRFNCTVRFLDERARAQAEKVDARRGRAPQRLLEGMPFTVKDVIDVAGSPTTGGSCTRSDAAPAVRSAFAIERLEAAGAIPVAKDSTTEFAASGPDTPLMGVCTNPWDTSRWAGGSSSGTAVAVATGAVPFGIGTDVGGSIRLPAAWCGVTGLKPTAGRVSRTGVIPMSWTAEAVGPIARDAATLSAVFRVLAGHDPDDPRTHPGSAATEQVPENLDGMSLAVPTDPLFTECDASITRGIREVVEVLAGEGVTHREARIPDAEHAHDAGYQIVFPELAAVHRPLRTAWSGYGAMTSQRMSRGITSPVSDYLRAQQFGHHLQTVLLRELATASALLVPTVAGSAPTLPDALMTIDGNRVPAFGHQARITMICNLTGFPGLSFPIGFDAEGLPVSAMLIGRPNEEHILLALAQTYQSMTAHHAQRPVKLR
jgi:aspartyl-tRNA(Asn)/glutamyl-tRNA(Gln) amidotransferase subunit A